MLHVHVQRFDVMGIAENILETKHNLCNASTLRSCLVHETYAQVPALYFLRIQIGGTKSANWG